MVDEKIIRELELRCPDKRLPCALAFRIAEESGAPLAAIGQAANALGVKIINCQLGCFGDKSRSKG